MEENILILSAGTRDKVVQYFVKEFNGSGAVIATDCSDLAPAIYDADRFHIVPRIDAPGYIDGILDICRRDKIRGVFSLIDPELSMLARDRARFEAVGTLPIVSPYELVEECFDKDKMSEYIAITRKESADARDFISNQPDNVEFEYYGSKYVKNIPVDDPEMIYSLLLTGRHFEE